LYLSSHFSKINPVPDPDFAGVNCSRNLLRKQEPTFKLKVKIHLIFLKDVITLISIMRCGDGKITIKKNIDTFNFFVAFFLQWERNGRR